MSAFLVRKKDRQKIHRFLQMKVKTGWVGRTTGDEVEKNPSLKFTILSKERKLASMKEFFL